MKDKKAQVEVTFHWVYILIAGAIILLFFVGLVVRGKVVAEKSLEEDVVRIMESILTGAGVAEKTKNFVKTDGLADYTIEFKCEEGYAGFGIKEGAFRELPTNPVFAPKEIKTTNLILWSLPYKMPYKIMDLLMVTSINTKYFVVGGEGTPFREELEKSVDGLNFDFVNGLDEVDPGNNFHVRVVDLIGGDIGQQIPEGLKGVGDRQVSAVSFSGSGVNYFQKEGNEWKRLGETIPIVSVAEEKDAAKYAAIFAGDGESYKCNMKKVFQRMKFVNEVYGGKLSELSDYYEETTSSCKVELVNTKSAFILLDSIMPGCIVYYDSCDALEEYAGNLKISNKKLLTECVGLY